MTPSGACSVQTAPRHGIPFRPGYRTEIMQAYHGYRTHKDDVAYAIDFRCEPGTPIVATQDGVVWDVREDSNRGCDERTCIDDGNYVVLDHGNGSFTEYHHLQQFGALVEPGEQVCRGEVVGLCGNTGYSTGPHLHFALTDAAHRTVPSRLPRRASKGGFSVPIPETSYVSHNRLDVPCESTSYSKLPADAFAYHGVVLDRAIPMVVDAGDEVPVRGTYHGDHPNVAIHRKPVDRGEWTDRCIAVDEAGRFSTTIRWPEQSTADVHWLVITGADDQCLSPGWAWSYKVTVD